MQCVFTTNLDQQVSKGVSECLCYVMAHVSVCNLIDNNNNNNNNSTAAFPQSGSSSAGIQVISTSDIEQLLITAGSQSETRTVALRALAIAVN